MKGNAIALFDFPSTVHVHVHMLPDTALITQLADIAATLHAVQTQGNAIMSKISDFATAQNAHNDKIDVAVEDLSGDVAELNRQIAALQATQGEITAEDQVLLDGIQARSQAISDKLEALAAQTPPVVPANP